MFKRKLLFLFTALIFSTVFAMGQTFKNGDLFRSQLEGINVEIAGAFLSKDIDQLIKYYDAEAICMPEYHKPLYSKNGIKNYYQHWFDSASFKSYKRIIFKLEQVGDYLLEIGTFSHKFNRAATTAMFSYDGKYLNVWKVGKNNELILISEIWGADNPVDRSIFSFTKINETFETPGPTINKNIEREVNSRNQRIKELVTKRDGERHATEFFTEDAIYLTYDSPMFIGMETIKPYFMEHEKPDNVSIDSLSLKASKMINLKNVIIEYGYYTVDVSWNNNKEKATISGKSTNIWKRDKTGKLMIYRQMVNHD
jgi:ketosteroid isomerase-like protein